MFAYMNRVNLMNYAHKGDARDKRTRGRQDDVCVIVVIQSSPTLSVCSAYGSHHPVNLSSSVLSKVAEAEYRTGCFTTM